MSSWIHSRIQGEHQIHLTDAALGLLNERLQLLDAVDLDRCRRGSANRDGLLNPGGNAILVAAISTEQPAEQFDSSREVVAGGPSSKLVEKFGLGRSKMFRTEFGGRDVAGKHESDLSHLGQFLRQR